MNLKRQNMLSLSKRIGVSHTTVKRWLDGAQPASGYIQSIAAELNCGAQWLLTGEGEMQPPLSAAEAQVETHVTQAEVDAVLVAGPEGAFKRMEWWQLETDIAEWAVRLEEASPSMKPYYLDSLIKFAAELKKRFAAFEHFEKPRPARDPGAEPPQAHREPSATTPRKEQL